MAAIDVGRVSSTLTSRFALEILPSSVELEGGRWSAVRPSSPEEPNGFTLVLARTPRTVVAMFKPDRFAGALMRAMSDADDTSRSACVALVRAAEASAIAVRTTLDGELASAAEDLLKPWRTLDLECEKRWSGTSYDADAMVIDVASAALSILLALLSLEEDPIVSEPGLPEGARVVSIVNRYERSPANRAACIAYHGETCAACGFDFARTYGAIGKGYIEVHHRTPVSLMGGAYVVDPVRDLVPLCANCHAIAHRRSPPLEVDEIRRLLPRSRDDVT